MSQLQKYNYTTVSQWHNYHIEFRANIDPLVTHNAKEKKRKVEKYKSAWSKAQPVLTEPVIDDTLKTSEEVTG